MKKLSPKSKSTRKTELDTPCWKFWLLVKGQRKKSKSTDPGSKSMVSAHRSDPGGPGRVGLGQRSARWCGVDEATLLTCLMMWTRADVDVLAWLLTWSDDVIWWRQVTSVAVSACGRSVQFSPACGGEARNPGGAWWRVQRRMTTIFSGQVDRWTTRPSWRCVWLRSKLGVENLRRRVWEFQEPLSACGGACGCRWRSGS